MPGAFIRSFTVKRVCCNWRIPAPHDSVTSTSSRQKNDSGSFSLTIAAQCALIDGYINQQETKFYSIYTTNNTLSLHHNTQRALSSEHLLGSYSVYYHFSQLQRSHVTRRGHSSIIQQLDYSSVITAMTQAELAFTFTAIYTRDLNRVTDADRNRSGVRTLTVFPLTVALEAR